MGITRTKRTVACECGCDYGSLCGKTITFLFCYNRSVDVGTLYIKDHSEKPDSKYEFVKGMGDNEISALINVLSENESIEPLTDEDRTLI